MDIYEMIGYLSGIMAITGVILNNYRLRVCFVIWLASNAMSAGIHAHTETWSLLSRDVVFIGLAIHGYWMWSKDK